ncbi:uncharacterized protein LOC126775137 [Nymphalis io]|uniref:uncharacterized protein LOC126775137 n=1 Tax=Inachis io TaxID=171585 RepID=UPI00216A6B57|nr:uncharacterized protein LOC126775137 [Nymphalis io]XP_050352876.1 uncharacterized protein LOC126775137 [Nymphalis io]XP_050352877.1 uncharacterized protein LOC126775137 [Nymphalis io]
MAGGREGFLFHQLPEPDDSGIDSDGTERARAQHVDEAMQLTETSSSDEDPAMKLPWIKRCMKKKFEHQLNIMEEGLLERQMLIPMVQLQPRVNDAHNYSPNSPNRSSPPLIEVELTASDEDDDNSVLEFVIPLPCKRPPKTTFTRALDRIVLLFNRVLCC